jgi:phage/plasmid-like protein (TIGR03299 family)
MSAYFNEGFFVREPAWHQLGVVLDEYPGREEAMRLAGHDFQIAERPVVVDGADVNGWKALVKLVPEEVREAAHERGQVSGHGTILHVAKESYAVVQNEVGWDIVDALVGEGAKYETGITLKDGAICSVLAWLPEPSVVPGDDSEILPWVNVSWSHDGSSAITARATSIRTVCWNTQSASEAQGKRLGTDFTFRHTKKVMERIEDAKLALQGVRDAHEVYMELARELAETPVTGEQRELFVTSFIPMPPEALISDRVKENIEAARKQVRGLFGTESVPEAHQYTAYGLHLVGTEYLDHLRGARSPETRFGRALLRNEPAKQKMTRLIREVAKS